MTSTGGHGPWTSTSGGCEPSSDRRTSTSSRPSGEWGTAPRTSAKTPEPSGRPGSLAADGTDGHSEVVVDLDHARGGPSVVVRCSPRRGRGDVPGQGDFA